MQTWEIRYLLPGDEEIKKYQINHHSPSGAYIELIVDLTTQGQILSLDDVKVLSATPLSEFN